MINKYIKKIKTSKNPIVIGDIHGSYKQLKKMYKYSIKNDLLFIAVGDLIDKGKENIKVINFFIENNIESVLGNHEQMFIECEEFFNEIIKLNKEKYSMEESIFDSKMKESILNLKFSDWWLNGGEKVFKEYKELEDNYKTLQRHLNWIKKLPVFIVVNIDKKQYEITPLLVSHSLSTMYFNDIKKILIKEKNDLDSSKKFILEELIYKTIWNRHKHTKSKQNKTGMFNIFGHTPVEIYNSKKYSNIEGKIIPKPEIDTNFKCAAIDTGCACTIEKTARGYLTGLIYPSLEYKQYINKY